MFERLRRAIVESYVGAIALGYVLAQSIGHFASIFTSPISRWVSRTELRELREVSPRISALHVSLFDDALPELMSFLLLLLVWYTLMRWLYFRPLKKEEPPQPALNPERSE